MSDDLFWPGAHRAADLFDDRALVAAMLAVEQAWLDALVDRGVAPADAAADLGALAHDVDVDALAVDAERGGNPVMGLVGALRDRASSATKDWLHRGLTSQDVFDTALVLLARTGLRRVGEDLRQQAVRLAELATTHRGDPAVGRTLTQHAVPVSVGGRLAGWLHGVMDALEVVDRVRSGLPAQLGGAAGTHAATVELAGDVDLALAMVSRAAENLGLTSRAPWHSHRGPLTEVGDALVRCTDAWGHVASDVLVLTRPEIGELREGSGGGSSSMPHKANPVLSVLVRRAALAAPPLASTLHLAAATSVEERPDGAWHAEWDTLRLLLVRTVVAAGQVGDLLTGLVVDVERARQNLAAAVGVTSEQDTMARLAGRPARAEYTGASGALVDAAVERARRVEVLS